MRIERPSTAHRCRSHAPSLVTADARESLMAINEAVGHVAVEPFWSPDGGRQKQKRSAFELTFESTGGLGRNRTTDTRIFNPHVFAFPFVDVC